MHSQVNSVFSCQLFNFSVYFPKAAKMIIIILSVYTITIKKIRHCQGNFDFQQCNSYLVPQCQPCPLPFAICMLG